MRTKAIGILTKTTGDARKAAAYWQVLVEKACGGQEPSEDEFALINKDEALATLSPLHRGVLATLWPEKTAEPKGRKFKADKARTYSAAEIVSFVAADPKIEGLRAEYMRRTGGKDALFYVNGKIAEAESADRIQRLFDRDPVAPFVAIGGRDVEPTGYPEDAAKADAEDPYQRGVALGQPGDVSTILGVSLVGIDHETRQAIACAMAFDLADASRRELQADAAAAKGQDPLVYLANKPIAWRKWPTWPKPSLVMTRKPPFAEPLASTMAPRGGDVTHPDGWVPTLCVLGARDDQDAWKKLEKHLAVAVRGGIFKITSDRDTLPGEPIKATIAANIARSDAMLCLVTPTTMGSDVVPLMKSFSGPKVPVVLESISSWDRILPGLRPIPPNGKPARGDDALATVAEEIILFAQGLRRKPT